MTMVRLAGQRNQLIAILSIGAGLLARSRWPFPGDHPLLQLLLVERPYLFQALKAAYTGMLFTTPFIALSMTASFIYIFAVRQGKPTGLAKLPSYPGLA